MSEVVIRINGDIKHFSDSLKAAQGKTEEFEGALKKVATISGVAFAALTAEVGLSVKAFAASQEATNRLTRSLQTQGIYSAELVEQYREQASALQALTGEDDDAIVKGQAVLQSFTGRVRISKELTQATLDLAAAQGLSLESAFQLVGKSIGSSTNALSRYGIELDANATKEEKMAALIDAVNGKFEGQAAAAAQGLGSLKLLTNTFGDLQEEIGERFAPAIEAGAKALTAMLRAVADNKPVVDFIASVITAGVVVGGLGTVVGLAGIGFLKLKAALQAAQVATSAMALATKGLVAATGLGLLVILLTEIALNWNSVWPRMQGTFQAFVNNIGTLGQGLVQILKGIFSRDLDAIKAGWEEAKLAFTQGFQDYNTHVDAAKAERDAAEQEEEFAKQERNAEVLTETEELNRKVASDLQQQKAEDKRKADEQFIKDQMKFGTAYAEINRHIHSDEVNERKQATGELVALQSSSNATLRAIGKAAALYQIGVKTAESAMNIYAGFSTIPIIGPALGIAGAAAAIAFGAEQAAKVANLRAYAQGGVVTGGVAGRDSVPIMAMPGELVSPTANFEEVIGSVRAMREAERLTGGEDGGGGVGGGIAHVVIETRGDFAEKFELQVVERRRLNVSLI